MAETKLTRDHHLLTRNLKLNDKYISNDGGNEGISINDNGEVTFKSSIGLSLDGTTDYVDLGSLDLINTDDYSISAWFKTSEAAYGVIVNKTSKSGGNDSVGWNLYISGDVGSEGKLKFWHRTGTGEAHIVTVTSDDVLSDGSWHHVIITADRDGNLLMYVDGDTTPDDTVVVSSRTTTINPNTSGDDAHLLIGMESADLSASLASSIGDFNGSIDEVAIFNTRILGTSDVTAFYNNGAPKDISAEASLIGYWRFDEGAGTNVEDSSSKSNNGTLTNGATWGAGAGGTAITKLEINSNVINARKNISLNGYYISNDGSNEGISINNDGDVFLGGVNGGASYEDGVETVYNTQTGSVSLTSSSQYVNCTNIIQLRGAEKFTIAVWAKHDEQANACIWSMRDTSTGGDKMSLISFSGDVRATVTNGSDTGYVQNGTSEHEDDVWEFWVVVYDGDRATNSNRLKLYKNGALLTVTHSGVIPATLPAWDHADDIFILGKEDGNPWDGNIGEVSLWVGDASSEAALGATDILALYDNHHPFPPDEVNVTDLVGWWTFQEDDFSDTTIVNSANVITGTAEGTYDATLEGGASYEAAEGLFAATSRTSGNPGFTLLRGNFTMNRGQFLTNKLSSNKGLSMNSSGAVDIEGSVGTGHTGAGTLTLSTAELTVVDNDVLGMVQFQAPKESDGGDAVLPAAAIWAESEGTFSASVNSTALVFSTATSQTAIHSDNERMRIDKDGKVGIGVADPDSLLEVFGTTTQQKWSYDANSFATITVADNSITTIATGESGGLTLDSAGDIHLNADGGDITFKDGLVPLAAISQGRLDTYYDINNYLRIEVSSVGVATLSTLGGTATAADLIIDSGGDITLDSGTGKFEMKGTGTTAKFADMYAGMILGYTVIGLDEVPATHDVLASMTVVHDDLKVSFVFPPSGKVEIFASIYVQTDSARPLTFGLSTTDASTGFTSLGAKYENHTYQSDETDGEQHSHRWYVTGTAGDSEELWFAAGCTASNRYDLYWGGDSSAVADGSHPIEYQPFVMKATALPATINTG